MACAAESWSPEVYEFYGDGETILEKFKQIDMNLPDRRIYVFTLEGEGNAELRLFEKEDDETMCVEIWENGSLEGLREQVHEAIMANRGVACVGEQTKALIGKAVETKQERGIPAPVSPHSAFAHSLQRYPDEFVRASVFLMC